MKIEKNVDKNIEKSSSRTFIMSERKIEEIKIEESIYEKVKNWLKEDGINFFKDIKDKYGEVDAVFMDGGIPHPVHLREGMQVRNFLRKLPECKDWNDIDLDDNWVAIIEEVIK